MEQLPVPIVTFNSESRAVDVSRVFVWLGRGCSLFIAEPAQWLLMTLVLMLCMMGLSIIPLIGGLAAMLLTPVFVAGMLCAARHVDEEQDPGFDDLFAGFSQKLGSLIILGALYAVAQLFIMLAVLAVIGGGVLGGVLRGDVAGVSLALGGTLTGMLLVPILFMPLCMAMWFAPALVFFEDAPPVAAIKVSFEACWKNILPFLVYGVLMFIASIVAALPFMLGFLVFLPVLFGSMLVSYRDIFVNKS